MKVIRSLPLMISLFLIIFSSSVFANSWKKSFYTDDSEYYLKLYKDGFTQRFRVAADSCSEITNAQIVFFKDIQNSSDRSNFIPLDKRTMTKWPSLYGIDEENYCWFEVSASGIDLNKPVSNKYIIKINTKSDANPYYFVGLKDSIIPERRITKDLNGINWIDLGIMGATRVEDGGVFFKIWEPIADQVHLVIGDNEEQPFFMIEDAAKGSPYRSHVAYISDAGPGTQYRFRFIKNGVYETYGVGNFNAISPDKIDPMAKAITYKDKGGYYNGYVDARAVVPYPSTYEWQADHNLKLIPPLDFNNWIIYQLWPNVFNPKIVDGKHTQGTFLDIVEKVPYLHDLGVTAVELLPINEHRFNAGWGYALDSLSLIEKTIGTTEELKYMVDSFHQKNIKVILDIVINHINNNLLREPISATVLSSKLYGASTEWGPAPNFANIMVQKWLMDTMLYLTREFHVDGFRFDMTNRIQVLNGGYKFLQDMNVMLKLDNPNFFSSAEELSDDIWFTMPVIEGGAGFDSQWNDKFQLFFKSRITHFRPHNRSVDMAYLRSTLWGFSNHANQNGEEYNFGPPTRTVNYLGSHDFVSDNGKAPIVRLLSDYARTEYSFEETIQNNKPVTFDRVRPMMGPNPETAFRLIHNQFTHSAGKLAYGILFTKPGHILFYQGEEMASDISLENEWSYVNGVKIDVGEFPTQNVDLERYLKSHKVPWEYLDPSNSQELSFLSDKEKKLLTGYHAYIKDLIAFKRAYPQINDKNVTNVQVSPDNQIIAYQVNAADQSFFVIANFGDKRDAEWINFPANFHVWWEEIINSSDLKYGGASSKHTNIISYGAGKNNHIRIPATSIMIFKSQDRGNISKELYLKGTHNNWQTQENMKLISQTTKGDVYFVDFEILETDEYEFKLATNNWEVELGSATNFNKAHFNLSGSLSYRPDMPNIAANLKKGKYKFLFNINNFAYNIIPIE